MAYSSLTALVYPALTAVTAIIGASASVQARTFYLELEKPKWAPPGYLFGPVWTLLYIMMAIAAYRVAAGAQTTESKAGLLFFVIQLVLNDLWSWLFFRWRSGALAMVDIVALWIVLVISLVCFWRLDLYSGLLLVPYLAWVTFASFLNWSIWKQNGNIL
jgi:tryptophan-rich sensory protein